MLMNFLLFLIAAMGFTIGIMEMASASDVEERETGLVIVVSTIVIIALIKFIITSSSTMPIILIIIVGCFVIGKDKLKK